MTEEAADTRSRILDAAEQAFADGGHAGARVNAIAKAAGVNKAMLYYYFESKEGLYGAVLERVFDQVTEVLVAHIEETEEADFAGFLAGYRTVLRSHPNFVRLMMRDLADGGPNVIRALGPRLPRVVGTMSAALSRGQQSGAINPALNPQIVTPILIAPFVLFSVANPVLSAATGMPGDALTVPFDETAEEILLRGLLARKAEES